MKKLSLKQPSAAQVKWESEREAKVKAFVLECVEACLRVSLHKSYNDDSRKYFYKFDGDDFELDYPFELFLECEEYEFDSARSEFETLKQDRAERYRQTEMRKQALAKLTAEEKEALGL